MLSSTFVYYFIIRPSKKRNKPVKAQTWVLTGVSISDIFNERKRLMEKERLIQLTNAVYRLTVLFPKKEPLRYKIREVANCILVKPQKEDLEVLQSFFEVAKEQKWVREQDVLAIQAEYANLGEVIKVAKTEKKKTNPGENPGPIPVVMAERQEKILAFLKEQGRVQVWQVKQVFPDVTKRTLRRDFEHMLGQGVIERIGERNDTFYHVKISQA